MGKGGICGNSDSKEEETGVRHPSRRRCYQRPGV